MLPIISPSTINGYIEPSHSNALQVFAAIDGDNWQLRQRLLDGMAG